MPIPRAVGGRDRKLGCEREREKRLRSRDENHGGEFNVEAEETREVAGAQSVEEKPPTKKIVPEFCLSFAKTVLQLVSSRTQKKVETTIQLVYEVTVEAGKHRLLVKEVENHKRLS